MQSFWLQILYLSANKLIQPKPTLFATRLLAGSETKGLKNQPFNVIKMREMRGEVGKTFI